ncbi:hypothetical protein FKM82_022282 [Ascaphus truei]
MFQYEGTNPRFNPFSANEVSNELKAISCIIIGGGIIGTGGPPKLNLPISSSEDPAPRFMRYFPFFIGKMKVKSKLAIGVVQ